MAVSDVVAAILFKHGLERIASVHTVARRRFGWRIKCAECGHPWPCDTRELVIAALRDGQDELMEHRS